MNVKNKVLRGCGSAAVAFGAASAMLPAQAFADEGSGVAAILPQMDEFIPTDARTGGRSATRSVWHHS